MNSRMDHLDIFLNSKESYLKDDTFDILDVDGNGWCMDEDKILESIRYGDKMPVEVDLELEACEVTAGEIEVDSPEEIFGYVADGDGGMSPCSASSGSTSSDQYEDQNHNVKVVQLVGILPPGVKAIQILQDQDGEMSLGETICESSGEQSSYQELKLSEEEKRLLAKEQITLPSHYPLTKYEERELKRIRRKIRNKISAQDSRKRKKEFLDKLQQKVSEVEDEKTSLSKKVRTLESANQKLTAQVKRLQAALTNATSQKGTSGNGGNNHIPAATTLLVLILSLALVVLPTMQNKSKQTEMENAIISAFEDSSPNTSIVGRSRTMMGVGMAKKMGPSASLEEEGDWSEEPLMKMPRFSFQQPSTGGGRQMQPLKVAIGNIGNRRPPASRSFTNVIVDENIVE